MQLLYKVANAPIADFPYPHILVHDVFPADFYQEMRRHLPPAAAFKSLKALGRVTGDYSESRGVLPLVPEQVNQLDEPYRAFWTRTAEWLIGGSFGHLVLQKFAHILQQRFPDFSAVDFYGEALVVLDRTTYSLGPHTDTPSKVASFLFYLPADESMRHLGTSLYLPRQPGFQSEGGEHLPFENFQRLSTMPYVPNTLFAFIKTPNAFHGVEPIAEQNVERPLLLFDIRHRAKAPPAGVRPSARFTF